jgi:predicted nicotinamide N-methyase
VREGYKPKKSTKWYWKGLGHDYLSKDTTAWDLLILGDIFLNHEGHLKSELGDNNEW